MSTVLDVALPALFVIVVWWASTGAIFYANGRPRRTQQWSLAGIVGLAVLADYAILFTRNDPGPLEAAIAFAAAIAIWGLIEMTFLMGYITGPRRTVCPPDTTPGQRFRFACLAIAHHEIAILAALALIAWQTAGAANFVAAGTFGLLWLMRLSTKLNLFFGVPNTAAELLPPQIAYMKSYFRRAPMSGFFPLSVSAATVLTCVLAIRAGAAPAASFEITGYAMLAALSALGMIEHWFLVLPIPAQTLWGWSLAGRARPDPMPTDKNVTKRRLDTIRPLTLPQP